MPLFESKFEGAMRSLFFAFLVSFLFVGGCTNISILDEKGVVSIHREFGFTTLNAGPGTDAIIAKMTSLGYIASPIGVSVGYGDHSVALLPKTCRVVLWVENENDIEDFRSLIGDNISICTILENQ